MTVAVTSSNQRVAIVVGIALHGCADAGLPFVEDIGAGADARLPVDRAVVLRRHDRDMIVAGDVGKVGIAAGKLEDHLVAVRLDVGNGIDIGLGGRLRVLAHMVAEGGDHVGRGDGLAVVEGDALAQLEHPVLGIVARLEALGQVGNDATLGVDLGQAVAHRAPADGAGHLIGIGGGVERVGGGAMPHAHAEVPALLGLGAGGGGEHGVGGGGGETGGHRQLHEIAARHSTLAGQLRGHVQLELEFLHEIRLPWRRPLLLQVGFAAASNIFHLRAAASMAAREATGEAGRACRFQILTKGWIIRMISEVKRAGASVATRQTQLSFLSTTGRCTTLRWSSAISPTAKRPKRSL